jgi:hypothetical protein
MDHWLIERVLQGKPYDVVWDLPPEPAEVRLREKARRLRRLGARLTWRRPFTRPAGARL